MKRKRKNRICKQMIDDIWGNIFRKARERIRYKQAETNKVVRLIRWSFQRYRGQREDKEFYLRRREIMRKKRSERDGRTLKLRYKLKRYYSIRTIAEYKRIIKKANREKRGKRIETITTSDIVLGLMERRLESVIYRLQWARSIVEARIMIKKGYFIVNGEPITEVKRIVKVGDVVGVEEKKIKYIKTRLKIDILNGHVLTHYPRYMEVDYGTLRAVITKDLRGEETPYIGRIWRRRVESVMQ
jgi:small subunit ribosomal protein S4